MIISVDFDGTCVTHEYPNIGKNIGAEVVLKALADNGYKIICTSMRSNGDKKRHNIDTVGKAKEWFESNNIPLYGFNDNPDQNSWSDSRKIYANLYIDDQFLGTPLMLNREMSDRAFVNWFTVAILLGRYGLIPDKKQNEVLNRLIEKYPELYHDGNN